MAAIALVVQIANSIASAKSGGDAMADETVHLAEYAAGTALRRPAARGGAARQGLHHRHGRGDRARQQPTLEPHRDPLCATDRSRRKQPDPRHRRTVRPGSRRRAGQRRAGPCFRVGQSDQTRRGRASWRHVVAARACHRAGTRQQRPRPDHRHRRRLRGDVPHRPSDEAQQRAARLPCPGHHRAVRRGRRRRQAVAARRDGDDQRAWHCRFAGRRADGVRAIGRPARW